MWEILPELRGIRNEAGVNVRFKEPGAAVVKILQKRLICAAHIARPHDLCSVDVRRVVDPLDVWMMIFPIPHQDEVFGVGVETTNHSRAVDVQ